MCLALRFSTSALAYNEIYLVHQSGSIAPGANIGGQIHPTLGRYMGIIVGAGLLNAPDGVTGTLEFTMPPIYFLPVQATNQAKAELIWEGTLASEYVVGGNTWELTNQSSYTMAYSIAIIERWDD